MFNTRKRWSEIEKMQEEKIIVQGAKDLILNFMPAMFRLVSL